MPEKARLHTQDSVSENYKQIIEEHNTDNLINHIFTNIIL